MSANTNATKAAETAKTPSVQVSLADLTKIAKGGVPFIVGGKGQPAKVAAVCYDERDASEWLKMFEAGLV